MSTYFWLPERRPAARLRLYCFAHAGAGASTFGRWGSAAPRGIEIAAIQLPGREERMDEKPIRKLTDAAQRVGEAIVEAGVRPLALFGHSAGGKLAAHVALRLQGTAYRPMHLFVSAGPVSVPRDEWLHQLNDMQFARAVAKEFGALPAEITADPELWKLFEPPLRADLEALETDDITAMRLDIPVTVISGARDDLIETDELADWKTCADRIVYTTVDADHFSYRTSPGTYFDVITRHLFAPQ